MLNQLDDWPSDPAHYIEDCRIFDYVDLDDIWAAHAHAVKNMFELKSIYS